MVMKWRHQGGDRWNSSPILVGKGDRILYAILHVATHACISTTDKVRQVREGPVLNTGF